MDKDDRRRRRAAMAGREDGNGKKGGKWQVGGPHHVLAVLRCCVVLP